MREFLSMCDSVSVHITCRIVTVHAICEDLDLLSDTEKTCGWTKKGIWYTEKANLVVE